MADKYNGEDEDEDEDGDDKKGEDDDEDDYAGDDDEEDGNVDNDAMIMAMIDVLPLFCIFIHPLFIYLNLIALRRSRSTLTCRHNATLTLKLDLSVKKGFVKIAAASGLFSYTRRLDMTAPPSLQMSRIRSGRNVVTSWRSVGG